MSFPRYENYKDSGVEWLGEVPGHWEVPRIRHLFKIKKHISGAVGYKVLSITQQGIKIKDTESGDGQLSMDYSKYQFVEIGDFAMNHMDLLTGYVDISSHFGVTSPDYRVFRLVDKARSADRYYLYLFQNAYRSRIFFPFGQGSSQLGRWRLPTDEFNAFSLPRPTLQEQQTIAAFLDSETAKIDALIAEQQRLIELLKEKRQAVISHAVTKGLNPDAPMKDSGIDWLGEVPEHWPIVPLRWTSTCCSGTALINGEIVSESNKSKVVPVIGGNGIMGYALQANIDHEVIAIGRVGALCGNVHVIDQSSWITDNALILDPKSDLFDLSFLASVLISRNLNEIATKTAQPLITGTQVSDQRVPAPPLLEQLEIIKFLVHLTAKLDTLTTEAQRAIDLLKERRTALISAAVTGKIDVQGT